MHRALAEYAAPDRREELIRRYRHVIDRLARQLSRKTGDASLFDDLWSVGALGLLEAASRYSEQRNVRFETFVEHRVRGAMLDELRRMDHLPRRMREKSDRVGRARQKLSQQLGRDPSPDELATHLGLTVEEVDDLSLLERPPMPLEDAPLPAAETDPERGALAGERVERLTAALSKLPERLQILMALYYQEDLTYREIAGILEVSEPRVCQLHAKALGLLKEELQGSSEG